MSKETNLTPQLQSITEPLQARPEERASSGGEPLPNGMLCALTQRIMIISPLPERVKSLLVALSAQCYDVFSLHDYNPGMLHSLQPELLVYDAIPVVQEQESDAILAGADVFAAAKRHDVPLLVLMNVQSQPSFEAADLSHAEALLWPAHPEEALVLINRMLEGRPPVQVEQAGDIRQFKDIRIDVRKMTVDQDGRRAELTKTEYELLLYFMGSDGSVLSREALLHAVWGLDFFGGSNLVDAHIKSLRRKLGDNATSPRYIVTVRGAGYRLAD